MPEVKCVEAKVLTSFRNVDFLWVTSVNKQTIRNLKIRFHKVLMLIHAKYLVSCFISLGKQRQCC